MREGLMPETSSAKQRTSKDLLHISSTQWHKPECFYLNAVATGLRRSAAKRAPNTPGAAVG